MTTTAAKTTTCAVPPGPCCCAPTSSAARISLLTTAPFVQAAPPASGSERSRPLAWRRRSCDVAAEGRDPADGGRRRGVEDEQEHADGGGQLVGVSGERESSRAGQEPAGAGDEPGHQVFDQQHPGQQPDLGSDLIADDG